MTVVMAGGGQGEVGAGAEKSSRDGVKPEGEELRGQDVRGGHDQPAGQESEGGHDCHLPHHDREGQGGPKGILRHGRGGSRAQDKTGSWIA